MRIRRILLFVFVVLAIGSAPSYAAPKNEFFAMNTIARGEPAIATDLVASTGFAGIGGNALDSEMPKAMALRGLEFFSGYLVISFTPQPTTSREALRSWYRSIAPRHPVLWLAIEKVSSGQASALSLADDQAVSIVIERVRELADDAKEFGVSISLYHHSGYWMDRFEQSLTLLEAINRPNVGTTFNLCHWLKVEGATRDPLPVIKRGLPRLQFVTINGADTGDTKSMNWDRLIQSLERGSYDVRGFVGVLIKSGYAGPIGFQGYGITDDPRNVMTRSMKFWQSIDR